MKNYFVTINIIETYNLDIEADSEEEAIEKANDLLDKDKDKYHNDSSAEESAFEI